MFIMLVSEAVQFGEHLKPEFQEWKYRIDLDLISANRSEKAPAEASARLFLSR